MINLSNNGKECWFELSLYEVEYFNDCAVVYVLENGTILSLNETATSILKQIIDSQDNNTCLSIESLVENIYKCLKRICIEQRLLRI